MGRTIVIGDIHGCLAPLRRLLDRVAPGVDDTLVFLGDYIDRGPDSSWVVEHILCLRQQLPRLVTLKGNHEVMLLDFLHGRNRQDYLLHGGRETLASYGLEEGCGADDLPRRHLLFFQELLSYWEDERYIYAHAGIEPGVPLSQQNGRALFWGVGNFFDPKAVFPKPVVHGHVYRRVPLMEGQRIGIDTGAVYGGALTALILPQQRFISEPSETRWL